MCRQRDGCGEDAEAVRREERRRLRGELHDGLGPMLTATTLQLQTARRLVREDPEGAEAALAGLVQAVASAAVELRRVIDGLRPAALDCRDLAGAVEEQARTLSSREQLHVAVQLSGDLGSLPPAVEAGAYRIISEAVHNVHRHAQAHACSVRLARGRSLEIDVIDDGTGLAAKAPGEPRAGVGLESMRRRAADLGGTLTVESTPEHGTRVSARLPLPERVDVAA